MQVLLLATDEQPGLAPISALRAGPLVPVANRPVMARTLELLARAGQRQALVGLFNRGAAVAAYFGNGQRWGMELKYVTQREAAGVAGSLRFVAPLIRETLLVLPADMVFDLDIEAALAAHRAHGGPATLVLSRRAAGSPGPQPGAQGHVTALLAGGDALTPTGAYLLEPAALGAICGRAGLDAGADLWALLREAGMPIHSHVMEGYWNPLDSHSAFEEAQLVYMYAAYNAARPGEAPLRPDLPTVRYPSMDGRQMAPGIWVGLNQLIHPSVRLAAPVCIGESCWIGPEVELGPGAAIGSNVIIDESATVEHSTVLDTTYVGRLVSLSRRVVAHNQLIDPASGEATLVSDPFLLARATPALEAGQGVLRRLSGALGALLLLALALPILLPLALLAALASGGRVLVGLPRVRHGPAGEGRAGGQFVLLNLATAGRDGRVGPIGRWLRRSELARLPELINVLRGELRLVGVRPLAPEQEAGLTEEWQRRRRDGQPGFTGLWYVQGAAEDLDSTLVADAYYVATRTWREDCRIALATPRAWWRHLRARHGVPRAQTARLMQADEASV